MRCDDLNVNDIWATVVNWDFMLTPHLGCLLALREIFAQLLQLVVFTKPVEVLELFLIFFKSKKNIYIYIISMTKILP